MEGYDLYIGDTFVMYTCFINGKLYQYLYVHEVKDKEDKTQI